MNTLDKDDDRNRSCCARDGRRRHHEAKMRDFEKQEKNSMVRKTDL